VKGIINKGIQEFVESQFGPEAWSEVQTRAGCTEPFFAVSEDYPDQMTLDLVAAGAAVAGIPEYEVMVAYGRWLVPNTLKAHYDTYYRLAGATPRQFLLNINRVHDQVTRSMANAAPPRFEYCDLEGGGLRITYTSERHLCPVLRGLILGVGDLFGQELAVAKTACYHDGDPHCVMEVSFP